MAGRDVAFVIAMLCASACGAPPCPTTDDVFTESDDLVSSAASINVTSAVIAADGTAAISLANDVEVLTLTFSVLDPPPVLPAPGDGIVLDVAGDNASTYFRISDQRGVLLEGAARASSTEWGADQTRSEACCTPTPTRP